MAQVYRYAYGVGALVVTRAEGSGERELASGTGLGDPSWSPDGARLVVSNLEVGANDRLLYIMDANSDGLRPITKPPGVYINPSWSPDGRMIAFAVARRDFDLLWQIFTIDAGGAHEDRLTTSRADDMSPSWAPDGKRIAFARRPRGVCTGAIFIMHSDGSHEGQITRPK
jgi:TolB protein